MKIITALRSNSLTKLAALAAGLAALFSAPTAQAKDGTGGGTGFVGYNIQQQIVQGDMPLVSSYTLLITSPSTVVGPSVVNVNLTLLTSPGGTSTAQALSFVSLAQGAGTPLGASFVPLQGTLVGSVLNSAGVLTFTGPNQTIPVVVSVNVPNGNWAGSFGYELQTSGWNPLLAISDQGAFINVTATQAAPPAGPVIQITSPADQSVYTWVAGSGPLTIPYSIVGWTPDGSPLLTMNGSVNGNDLQVTPEGLGTANATASGTFIVNGPGVYTVSADDTNANGQATASISVTVNAQVGAPTVQITSPDANSTYLLTGDEIDIPYTFTGTSLFGGVRQLTATLDGVPVAFTPEAYGSLTCDATGVLPITSVGDHNLVVTCTDDYGTATDSETITVSVQSANPPPTVVINTPAPNAVFNYTVGGPNLSVPFTFTGSSTGGPITKLTATLDGKAVTFSTTGLNTLTANGTTTLSFSSASVGNHTLAVTATNSGGTASTSEIITIVSQNPTTSTLTVAINKPVANSTYTIPSVGGFVSIPDMFTAKSTANGGVTKITATLNGNPIAITPSTYGRATVTANGTLVISTPGVYTIGVVATDRNGTATTSEKITVAAPTPCPKVTITKPCDGATYTLGTSSCPLWVPVSLTANTTPGSTLSTLTLTLNGQPVTISSLSGLGSASATGSLNIKITSAGTYVLVATTTSGGVSATDTNTFKVSANNCNNNYSSGGWGDRDDDDYNHWGSGSGHYNDNYSCDVSHYYAHNPAPCNVNWQQSWSCSTTQKGGNSLPVCFQIQYTGSNCASYWNSYFKNYEEDYYSCDDDSRGDWGRYGYNNCVYGNVPSTKNCLNNNWKTVSGNKVACDTSVKVLVYEVYSNGDTSSAKTFACSGKTVNCSISNNGQYNFDFTTSKGTHTYRCDVYYTDKNTGKSCFLGSQKFKTK